MSFEQMLAELDGTQNTELRKALAELLGELILHDIRDTDELRDVQFDNERIRADWEGLVKRHRTELKPQMSGEIYLCPTCRKRARFNNSFCHNCGQRMSWFRR